MKYRDIKPSLLRPRPQIAGYVKVGGLEQEHRWGRGGQPWFPPTRYVNPARFEVATRERRTVTIPNPKGGKPFRVLRGYQRDQAFHTKLKDEKPRRLKVRLMYEHAHQNFTARLGAHNGNLWVCEGNGEEATDVGRGVVPCPCPRLDSVWAAYGNPEYTGPAIKPPYMGLKCKVDFRFWFILEDASQYGAFHLFKTTSWESAENIKTALVTFEKQFAWTDHQGEQHGGLFGLPLELQVEGVAKGRAGGGTATQPIVSLVLDAPYDTARQIAAAAQESSRQFIAAAHPLPESRLLRAAVQEEAELEEELEVDEFHHEAKQGLELPVVTSTGSARVRELAENPTSIEEPKPATPEVDRDAINAEAELNRVAEIEELDRKPVVPQPQPKEDQGPADEEPQEEPQAAEEEPRPLTEAEASEQRVRKRMQARYFVGVGKLGWSDFERKTWQVEQFGTDKHSCKSWEASDFIKAITALNEQFADQFRANAPAPPEEPKPEVGNKEDLDQDDAPDYEERPAVTGAGQDGQPY